MPTNRQLNGIRENQTYRRSNRMNNHRDTEALRTNRLNKDKEIMNSFRAGHLFIEGIFSVSLCLSASVVRIGECV